MKMNRIKKCAAILAACVCASAALGGCDFSKYVDDMQKKAVEDLKNETKAPGIEVGYASYELKGKNYKDVETLLTKSGFTNITLEPMGDMKVGIFVKEGDVDEVSIGGNTSFWKSTRANANETVIIRYHSYPQKDAGTSPDGKEEENSVDPSENTPASQDASPDTKEPVNSDVSYEEIKKAFENGDFSLVTPSFKEQMDNYEAFYDSYIEFMQKYLSGQYDVMSMMGDYMTMMEKIEQWDDEIDNIDENKLTPADDAYYLLVTLRVEEKLLKLY